MAGFSEEFLLFLDFASLRLLYMSIERNLTRERLINARVQWYASQAAGKDLEEFLDRCFAPILSAGKDAQSDAAKFNAAMKKK